MATHYDTLGITKTASEEDIKKAYRKLVLIHHPDKRGDENEFKKIKDAYDTLVNRDSRQAYDTPVMHNFFQMNSHVNISSLFSNISITPMRIPVINPNGKDFIYAVTLSKKDFMDEQGNDKNYESFIDLNITSKCFDCTEKCDVCNGQGFVQIQQKIGFFAAISTIACHICHGTGEKNLGCDKCKTGNISKNHKLNFHVPKSEYNLEGRNYFIQYQKLGEQPKKKEGQPGNFFIQINFN